MESFSRRICASCLLIFERALYRVVFVFLSALWVAFVHFGNFAFSTSQRWHGAFSLEPRFASKISSALGISAAYEASIRRKISSFHPYFGRGSLVILSAHVKQDRTQCFCKSSTTLWFETKYFSGFCFMVSYELFSLVQYWSLQANIPLKMRRWIFYGDESLRWVSVAQYAKDRIE